VSGKHGLAIAGAVLVLGAIVLVATWPRGGTPDDVRAPEVDAGLTWMPDAGELAPEEPMPVPPPPASAALAPASGVVDPSVAAAVPAPTDPSAQPLPHIDHIEMMVPPSSDLRSSVEFDHPRTVDDELEAANSLLEVIETRREQARVALEDAERRGDTEAIARLTRQRDGLLQAEQNTTRILEELEGQRAGEAPSEGTPPP
jgi:hypothetical protein